jgi:hypothetical protein
MARRQARRLGAVVHRGLWREEGGGGGRGQVDPALQAVPQLQQGAQSEGLPEVRRGEVGGCCCRWPLARGPSATAGAQQAAPTPLPPAAARPGRRRRAAPPPRQRQRTRPALAPRAAAAHRARPRMRPPRPPPPRGWPAPRRGGCLRCGWARPQRGAAAHPARS